ncbi:MAG: transporter substrate-binding domain-containing protein [Spirochaetota bacterium]
MLKGYGKYLNLKIVIAFLFLLIFPAIPPAEEAKTSTILKAAIPVDFPPYYCLDENGNSCGFAIDVMNRIAGLAKIAIEYIPAENWTEVDELVTSGVADLIPNFGITEERLKRFAYSTPVEVFPVSIFVKTSTRTIKGKEDLRQKRIGVVEYNIAETHLRKEPEIDLVVFSTPSEALISLLAEEIEALVYPQPVIESLCGKINIEERIKSVGKPLAIVKRAVAVRRDRAAILEILNPAIQTLIGSNEYKQMYDKWFGREKPFYATVIFQLAAAGFFVAVTIALLLWRFIDVNRLNLRLTSSLVENEKTQKKLTTALADREILIKEIHHRVKNNLNLIIGLINLQSMDINDAKSNAMFGDLKNRIKSIGLLHEQLYESTYLSSINSAEYLKGLISNLQDSFFYVNSTVSLCINIEEIYLDVEKAIPLGLIVTELITNAFKYAFPDNRHGTISLDLKHSNNHCELIISDNGVGLPPEIDIESTVTLGLRLVATLVSQLNAAVRVDRDNGTKWRITFT